MGEPGIRLVTGGPEGEAASGKYAPRTSYATVDFSEFTISEEGQEVRKVPAAIDYTVRLICGFERFMLSVIPRTDR